VEREKAISEFAQTQAGQEIIHLDYLGYKLAGNQKELTPNQVKFLLLGYSEMHRQQKEANTGQESSTGQEANMVKDLISRGD